MLRNEHSGFYPAIFTKIFWQFELEFVVEKDIIRVIMKKLKGQECDEFRLFNKDGDPGGCAGAA